MRSQKRSCRLRFAACLIGWIVATLLFSLPWPRKALALVPDKPIDQYVHSIWQEDEGLPQNYVVAIAQTEDGYLWLGTQEGLVRFDGIRFAVYDRQNTPQLKDSNIQALYADRHARLWMGTEGGGLVCLQGGQFVTYGTTDGLPSNIVEAIYEDSSGTVWVGTSAGLAVFKDGKITSVQSPDGLSIGSILAICQDTQGALWAGTDGGGLKRLSNAGFTSYSQNDGLPDDVVRSVYPAQDGSLWIGTRYGLSRLRDGHFKTFTTADGLGSNSVLAVYGDRDGNIWVGTDGGLNRYYGGKFSTLSKKDGLSDDSVAAIFEDRESNLWIGTYGGGLNRLKDARFGSLTVKSGLSDDMARSICQDHQGNVWIATRNGLNRLRDGRIDSFRTSQGLPSNSILSLYEDGSGALWVGTGHGLSRFKDGAFKNFATRDGLADETVLSIIGDRAGRLWIGTSSGLNVLKAGKFATYTAKDGLTNESIWTILEDRAGATWIGTDGGGLNRWRDGKFTAITTSDGLAHDVVLSLYEDTESTLWIGTSGGLNRMKNGKLTTYSKKDGLLDDVIFQILEDNNGNLWMSCNKGIFRLNKKQLDDYADGKIQSIECTSYGTADGMKSRECNGGFQPAGWKTVDGRLWFPTIRGVAVIDPSSLKVNPLPPPVAIEKISVDEQSVDATGRPSFAPGRQRFEFHFTGLSFVAPEKVRFKYKLEGFDKHWIEAGARRDASYTNLLPGAYKFIVIACNNDQVWNEQGASFEFYLRPHFYRTVWFYLAAAALIGILGFGLFRVRVGQMRARFAAVLAERTRLAREIHDTLAQNFVGIALQLEAVRGQLDEAPENARQHLDLASKMVSASLADARRTVWNLRPQPLEQGSLATALADIAHKLSPSSGAMVDFKVLGAEARLSESVENNLLRIGQEALTNAVKHGQPGHLSVELNYENDRVCLRIVDDGKGFDPGDLPDSPGNGFGLVGIRERAEQLRGSLVIDSRPGQGTRIEICVPIQQSRKGGTG